MPMKKDVFICHASEDKDRVTEPLVKAFQNAGITYWYDRAEIKCFVIVPKVADEFMVFKYRASPQYSSQEQ